MNQHEADEYWQARLEEEKPIRSDLAQLGFDIEYLHDLRALYSDYSSAVDTIYTHLKKAYSDRTLEDLARLLATQSAFYLWPQLLSMYKRLNPSRSPALMSGLALALSEHLLRSKNRELEEHVRGLVLDPSRGESRLFLIQCFRRKRDEKSLELIERLSADPDLKVEIASWKHKPR